MATGLRAAGALSDNIGRTITAGAFLAASVVCPAFFGFLQGALAAVLGLVGMVYCFAIVGDSPVFSTASPANRGAALGVIGFGTTIVSTARFTLVVDLWGWGPAFGMLAAEAAAGLLALWRLRQMPEARAAMAAGRG